MESDLEGQLQGATRQQLLILVRELALRYPQLHTEIAELLVAASSLKNHAPSHAESEKANLTVIDDIEETEDADDSENSANHVEDDANDLEEDWDFGGIEPLALHTVQRSDLQAIDHEAYRQRLADYSLRLQQGESLQVLAEDLHTVLEEAENRAEQHDYQGAIDLYALVIDERLNEAHPVLVHLLDKELDDIMPILETLLSEVSSNIFFDSSSLTPAMSLEARQQWLERLFALWLKRLDAHYLDESIPEMMLNMAWNEDVLLLHRMVQNALQQLPLNDHSNIVNFSQQYRTRTLERFLKELPRV